MTTASTRRSESVLRLPRGALVMGASAGAVEALSVLLPSLPRGYPVPVIITVHVSPDRSSLMAPVFAPKCNLPVREAEDKDPIEPGTIYFAPPGYHLLIERGGWFALSVDAPVLFSRPSINVLFDSAADAFGRSLVGVLLTGANEDGASGLANIQRSGGRVYVQTPDTALAPAMPLAALSVCRPDGVMSLQQMGPLLAGLKFDPAS